MTTPNQIAANRRNAQLSTGPKTKCGKERSRRNAWRHGLTAKTVIEVLEDPARYQAFAAEIIESYAPRSPIERELTLRLASLFWRLRRATAIEAGLFQIQAEILSERRKLQSSAASPADRTTDAVRRILATAQGHLVEQGNTPALKPTSKAAPRISGTPTEMAQCFLRVANLNNGAFERIGRYEAALWKQAAQTLLVLTR